MADFSNLVTIAPQLIRQIPVILQTIQILAYIVFMLFFGSIIIRGFRGYLPWYMRLIGRIGFGFIALVCAVAISPFIPILNTGIYKMIQLDLLIAGIITTIILTISMVFISNKIYNKKAIENSIERLKARLEKAKSNEKEMAEKSIIQNLIQPLRIAGILLFALFVVFALINFRGFPNPTETFLSGIGLSQKDIDEIATYIEAVSPNQTASMPQGCVSPLELVQNFGESILKNELPVYTDSTMKSFIESKSGDTVAQMYRIEYKQKVFTFAITTKQSLCSATGNEFCGCVSLGSIG